jgi:hypothetical protein
MTLAQMWTALLPWRDTDLTEEMADEDARGKSWQMRWLMNSTDLDESETAEWPMMATTNAH